MTNAGRSPLSAATLAGESFIEKQNRSVGCHMGKPGRKGIPNNEGANRMTKIPAAKHARLVLQFGNWMRR